MRLARPLACCVLAGVPLLITGSPVHADPTILTGKHAQAGMSIDVPGHGKLGTFTYEVDTLADVLPIAYCIDVHTKYREGAELTELMWSEAPEIADVGPQLNWVLRHSYPYQPLSDAATGSGAQFHDGLSEAEAITATQAALWHYSDGIDLTVVYGDASAQADVLALYAFLTGPANVGIAEDPPGTLSLSTSGAATTVDGLVGPITVSTSAPSALLAVDGPEGAVLVDKSGQSVAVAHDGDQVYLDVPDDQPSGSATVTAKAASIVTGGRIFAPADPSPQTTTQTLVLATTTHDQLAAFTSITWAAPTSTPPPTTFTPAPTSTTPPASTTTTAPPQPPAVATQPPPDTTTAPPADTTTVAATTTAQASASADLPAPSPSASAPAATELASTGASVGRTGLLAGGLLTAGGLALWAGRRR